MPQGNNSDTPRPQMPLPQRRRPGTPTPSSPRWLKRRGVGMANSRPTTTSRSWSCGRAERTNRLPHEKLRFAANQIVLQLSDEFVAQSFIKFSGPRVEGRHAEEHVRRLGEDPALGKLHQARAQSAAARVRIDTHRLNVADEGAAHIQDHEALQCAFVLCDVDLARRILYERQ